MKGRYSGVGKRLFVALKRSVFEFPQGRLRARWVASSASYILPICSNPPFSLFPNLLLAQSPRRALKKFGPFPASYKWKSDIVADRRPCIPTCTVPRAYHPGLLKRRGKESTRVTTQLIAEAATIMPRPRRAALLVIDPARFR